MSAWWLAFVSVGLAVAMGPLSLRLLARPPARS